MPGVTHRACRHDQHYRLSAPRSDLLRRRRVRAEVDVVTAHRPEPLAPDGAQSARVGAVIERLRRAGQREVQLHWHAVALVRPDAVAAQRVADFAVGGHHLFHAPG